MFTVSGAQGVHRVWKGLDKANATEMANIDRWKRGMTGYPLVDANMRELLQTGFMSNRGRQNVASFLVLDLGIDWRVGAHHFESLLLDSDVYSNYGNWNAAAGLIPGGRVNKFNIVKQSRDYDPMGAYIKYWIPELSNVSAPAIFEPWKLSITQQRALGVVIGVNYPEPIDIDASTLRTVPDKNHHHHKSHTAKTVPSTSTANPPGNNTIFIKREYSTGTSVHDRNSDDKAEVRTAQSQRKNRVQHL